MYTIVLIENKIRLRKIKKIKKILKEKMIFVYLILKKNIHPSNLKYIRH